ncbi:MAG TPA: hypothetical protein VFC82_02410 [Actinomycetaceae bacterium]|nr:hypothetical protein [Actinomycetaceae bacterium]
MSEHQTPTGRPAESHYRRDEAALIRGEVENAEAERYIAVQTIAWNALKPARNIRHRAVERRDCPSWFPYEPDGSARAWVEERFPLCMDECMLLVDLLVHGWETAKGYRKGLLELADEAKVQAADNAGAYLQATAANMAIDLERWERVRRGPGIFAQPEKGVEKWNLSGGPLRDTAQAVLTWVGEYGTIPDRMAVQVAAKLSTAWNRAVSSLEASAMLAELRAIVGEDEWRKRVLIPLEAAAQRNARLSKDRDFGEEGTTLSEILPDLDSAKDDDERRAAAVVELVNQMDAPAIAVRGPAFVREALAILGVPENAASRRAMRRWLQSEFGILW